MKKKYIIALIAAFVALIVLFIIITSNYVKYITKEVTKKTITQYV